MRLVDADAVIRFLDNIERFEDEDRLFTYEDVKKLIRETPTVEISAHPKTNGDRIRQMTDEELAAFIYIYSIEDICRTRCAVVNYQDCMAGERCKLHILEWLKQEVREDAGSKID